MNKTLTDPEPQKVRLCPCSFWLTCTNCGKRVLLASGFIGAALHEDDDKVYQHCERLGWRHRPDLCPDCQGIPHQIGRKPQRNWTLWDQ